MPNPFFNPIEIEELEEQEQRTREEELREALNNIRNRRNEENREEQEQANRLAENLRVARETRRRIRNRTRQTQQEAQNTEPQREEEIRNPWGDIEQWWTRTDEAENTTTEPTETDATLEPSEYKPVKGYYGGKVSNYEKDKRKLDI